MAPYFFSRAVSVKTAVLLFAFMGIILPGHGRAGEPGASRWSVVPVGAPYYTPDTSWGLGAYVVTVIDPATGAAFKTPDEITFYLTGTLKSQFSAGVMPDIYFNRGRLKLSGMAEISRYPGSFWGIGPGSRDDDEEGYTPREAFADLNLLFMLTEGVYAGPALHCRYAAMEETEDGGRLASGKVPGGDGTTETGIGAAFFLDTRDSIFYPTGGWYGEVIGLFHRKELGSEYHFSRMEADFRFFLGLYNKHVLAFQLKAELNAGTVPFQSMASLGGNAIMRGLMQNRYMDKTGAAFQAEYRFPLVWRLGGVLFAGAGEVQPSLDDYTAADLRFTGGTGLRVVLNREKHIAARLDLGFNGDGGMNIYFLVKEAF